MLGVWYIIYFFVIEICVEVILLNFWLVILVVKFVFCVMIVDFLELFVFMDIMLFLVFKIKFFLFDILIFCDDL